MTILKSPLKYPGGKSSLLKSNFKFPRCDRFIEPFAGSAVCSLNADAKQLVIADSNWDIVNFFSQIQQGHIETILYKCEEYWKAEADLKLAAISRKEYEDLDTDEQKGKIKYHVLRTLFNTLKAEDRERHALKLACLFLYLNRHGFNGLCRYNKKGEYNVPYGRQINPYFPVKELKQVDELFRTKNVKIVETDFEDLEDVVDIGKGDVVYCDPPYCPLDNKASFTTYDGHKFEKNDHVWLHDKCLEWSTQGAKVVLSNSYTEFTKELYKDQRIEFVYAKKSISASPSGKKTEKEMLVFYD